MLAGEADAYLRVHPGRDVAYLTVLVGSRNQPPVEVALRYHGRTHTVRVIAAAGGAAVMRIVDGALDDLIVTGINHHTGAAVAAACAVDGTAVAAGQPADIARVRGVWTQTHTH